MTPPQTIDSKTVNADDSFTLSGRPPVVGLTVLGHPDVSRVGEITILAEMGSGARCGVNRREPNFREPYGEEQGPLATRFVSRSPVVFEAAKDGGVRIHCDKGNRVTVKGTPCDTSAAFSQQVLEQGVVLVVSNAVVLLLHTFTEDVRPQPRLGLIGENPAMHQLRANILRVADLDVPVLLRGESGVGKELVARAIHDNSRGRDHSSRSVNMAAIPEKLGLPFTHIFLGSGFFFCMK